jgi:hypothetical protein
MNLFFLFFAFVMGAFISGFGGSALVSNHADSGGFGNLNFVYAAISTACRFRICRGLSYRLMRGFSKVMFWGFSGNGIEYS